MPQPRAVCPNADRTTDAELLRIGHEQLSRWWSTACGPSTANSGFCPPDPTNLEKIHALATTLERANLGDFHSSMEFEGQMYPLWVALRRGNPIAQRELAAWFSGGSQIKGSKVGASGVSVAFLYMTAMGGDARSVEFLADWLFARSQDGAAPEAPLFQQRWQLMDLLRRHADSGSSKAARLLARAYAGLSADPASRAGKAVVFWTRRATELESAAPR
jgi:hypothetical protein